MAVIPLLQWAPSICSRLIRKHTLATPNYGYEKRQRELAKKQKKEEKLRAKAHRKDDNTVAAEDQDGTNALETQEQPPAASTPE